MLILELNEFNVDLMREAARQLNLKFVQKYLSFEESITTTKDRYESGFLEPWVQWVSIHTGMPSSVHQIKHLGDVPSLEYDQIWEQMSRVGVTTGIWGVMNGSRRNAEKCRFFLPDPWTFSEPGYPDELNNLLNLPRYLSTNYLDLSTPTILRKSIRMLGFLFRLTCLPYILVEFVRLFVSLLRYGFKHYVFISFFDYISSLIFLSYKNKYAPQVSILFLNSIAHLQHHHWTSGENILTPPLVYGWRYIDRIFSLLEKNLEGENIVLMNGFSQMNTNSERPWILYRQKNPQEFLMKAGVPHVAVKQLMTNDAHILFANEADQECAHSILTEAKIDNQALFFVEKDPNDSKKLFFRCDRTDPVDKSSKVLINGRTFYFLDLFEDVVTRTGRHIPQGRVFSRGVNIPSKISSNDLFSFLIKGIQK